MQLHSLSDAVGKDAFIVVFQRTVNPVTRNAADKK